MPTDNAFAIYPDGTISELLANPAVLLDVLQYHLIVDSSSSAQLAELSSALTNLGEPVDISIAADGALSVNDVVIVQSDIQAANGIIHVINGLLVPPSATGLLASRTVNPQADTDTGARDLTLEQLAAADTSGLTVLEIISSIEGFTTLTAAVDAAGLNDALSLGGPITLLAPTNGAFAELPETELETLLNSQPDELLTLLQYHTILDGVTSADLARLGTVLTATGDPITVTVDNDGIIMINGGAATVYMADIEAANGVIHAISTVLTPPTQ
ncbi:MAG: fasciclin domain-containing protein [Caldilineaceae bacterium]